MTSDYYYDEEAAEYPIKWVQNYCKHTVGEKKGQYLLLDDWQKEIYRKAFGWKIKGSGKRKYSTIYVEIPRGNGKSTFGMGTGLYLAFGDGISSSHVFCCASSLHQAHGALFEPAKDMVKSEPALDEALSLYFNTIRDYESNSFFKLLSADWKGGHSLIPSAVIFDELHLQPDSKLWDSFQSGMAKRTDCTPSIWVFTTAGEINTFAHKIHNYALAVQSGAKNDESFLGFIWAANIDDDPFNKEIWEKANPGWHFLNHRQFRLTAERAKNEPSFLNTFKRYNLNMWTGSTEAWIPPHEWDKCNEKVDILDGSDCFGGLYFSSVRDIICFCLFFPGDIAAIKMFYWCPEAGITARRGHTDYDIWQKEGWIKATPGDANDHNIAKRTIDDLFSKYNIISVDFNRQNAIPIVLEMMEQGREFSPSSLTHGGIGVACAKLEEMVIKKTISHSGDPVLSWMMSNTQIIRKDDMIKPDSRRSRDNISGIMALVLAIAGWCSYVDAESATLTEGILFI